MTPGGTALARRLSVAIAAGMWVQGAAGLLYPALYRDAEWIRAAWFGADALTVLVGAPLIAAGMLTAGRGSVRGELLWYAGLAYGLYNYAYLALGAHLNPLFPLYVALLVACIWALVLALSGADRTRIADSFGDRTPVRAVAAYMAFTGVGLGIAWLAQWGAYVFGGIEPSVGEGPFRLVAAMDLTIVVPTMIIGAALLWRRREWGYLLGAIATVKGATYTAGLAVGSLVGGLRGVEGSMAQVPVWAVWTAIGTAAAAALLWRVRRSDA